MKSFEIAGSPQLPPASTVPRVMRDVLIALVPGIAAHLWFFGPGLLIQIALACACALALEAAMLSLRGKPLRPFLFDGSALVTAVLFALCIPPLAPWWVAATAMVAAIVFAKHLYGGIGYNLFNPAMVGFAVVIVCFPLELSRWLAPASVASTSPDLLESLRIIAGYAPSGAAGWDALAQATPLDLIRAGNLSNSMIRETRTAAVFGDFGGRGWEWIANFYALGGLWLLWRRVIHWQVPVAVIGSVILLSIPTWFMDPDVNPLPQQHLFMGGLMLCAFFIATDPVSGCATPRGRLIFGAGVAVLTLVIRRWGVYPDGVAFAVLLMNCAAPLLDLYTKPRVFGR